MLPLCPFKFAVDLQCPFNAQLHFCKCNPGYRMQGDLAFQLAIKNADSFFTRIFPPSAISCPDLDHPQYGSVRIIGKGVSSQAEYTCNNGYRLYGTSRRKCLYSGVWDGSVPTCKCKPVFHKSLAAMSGSLP